MFSCFLLGQGCALWAVDFPVCPGGSSSFLWSGTQAALASCHSLSVTVSDPFTLPPRPPASRRKAVLGGLYQGLQWLLFHFCIK